MANHNKVGEIGEELAVKLLKKKGYKIIKKNYRTKYAEIDIICKPKNNFLDVMRNISKPLVFLEVRTKTGEKFGRPEETINKKKLWKLKQNAKAFVTFNNYEGQYRVDAICIVLDVNKNLKRINHYKNIAGF